MVSKTIPAVITGYDWKQTAPLVGCVAHAKQGDLRSRTQLRWNNWNPLQKSLWRAPRGCWNMPSNACKTTHRKEENPSG